MALNLKRLKAVNDKDTFTVFGFIRNTQNELSMNVPMMIFYLCLGYFFEAEYFEKCGNNMQISADKLTITQIEERIGNYNGYALYALGYSFCKRWIKSHIPQIAIWKLKINRIHGNKWHLKIFITSDDKQIKAN